MKSKDLNSTVVNIAAGMLKFTQKAAEGVKALEILRYDVGSAQSGITAGILIFRSTGTATVSTE